jgi:hypothetical protein
VDIPSFNENMQYFMSAVLDSISNVPDLQISIVYAYSFPMFQSRHQNILSSSVIAVSYTLSLYVEQSGFATSQNAYDSITEIFTQSVANGQFVTTLQSSTPDFANAIPSLPIYGPLILVSPTKTFLPSKLPSKMPLVVAENSPGVFFEDFPLVGKVLFPIAIIFGGCFFCCCGYYFIFQHNKSSHVENPGTTSSQDSPRNKVGTSPDKM